MDYPTGELDIVHCISCGFIFNASFDPALIRYDKDYEGTQAFSATFNEFNKGLADRLAGEIGNDVGKVLEIGCGQGEFLELLCSSGKLKCVGYDPAYRKGRTGRNITIHSDFYGEGDVLDDLDMIICKMTLEHIHDPGSFLRTIRENIGDNDTRLFIQVPNFDHILKEYGFWDLYYEHCSYFTGRSLERGLRSAGFRTESLWTDYDDQYLMALSSPSVFDKGAYAITPEEKRKVDLFRKGIENHIKVIKNIIEDAGDQGLFIWGGGSKTVALLSTLGSLEKIRGIVDINPIKTGTYLPSSGIMVMAPESLKGLDLEKIMVMNPVYDKEIRKRLTELGIETEIIHPMDGDKDH